MRIGIVGGIFDKGGRPSGKMAITPETTLVAGLRERGHEVATVSHYDPIPSGLDIIHVHHLSWGALAAACHPSRARLVLTSHDGRSLCGHQAGLSRWTIARLAMARADGVVALSEAEAQFQRARYRVRGAESAVIPNGIPAQYSFAAERRAPAGEPWQFLYVGQFIPLKRVDVLFRALTSVRGDWRLRLAFHHAPLEPELRALADRLGIAGRVEFLGACSPERLAELYRQAHVLVLPSQAESWPSVVSEALLSGLPVIASRVGGIPEQLGSHGRLVRPGDPAALTEALQTVQAGYPDLMRDAGRVAAEARDRFSTERMVEHHLEFYRRVLARPKTRRHGPLQLAGNLACKGLRKVQPYCGIPLLRWLRSRPGSRNLNGLPASLSK